MRLARLSAALCTATLLACGCTDGQQSGTSPTGSAPASFQRYVALGDSYSAGPLIPTTDLAGGCVRSDHDYPSLVAARLHVAHFVDVTCSAATTRELTHAQHPFVGSSIPPQIDAVTPRTDLVTLGIGGNDLGLFESLVRACSPVAGSRAAGASCRGRLRSGGPDLRARTATIGRRVTGALRAVRHRAPRATVLLVGYLRLVPDRGSCPALPLAPADYAVGRRTTAALNRALARAAASTGATFVDMYAASRGHDICSSDPWVNGRTTDRSKALAFHPFAAGMRADADQVVAALGR
jgi:lysophospholipase L1-like esterase